MFWVTRRRTSSRVASLLDGVTAATMSWPMRASGDMLSNTLSTHAFIANLSTWLNRLGSFAAGRAEAPKVSISATASSNTRLNLVIAFSFIKTLGTLMSLRS